MDPLYYNQGSESLSVLSILIVRDSIFTLYPGLQAQWLSRPDRHLEMQIHCQQQQLQNTVNVSA